MIDKLSKKIITESLNIKKNEKVLITVDSLEPKPLVKSLIKEINKVKGIPFVKIIDREINSILLETTNDERINVLSKIEENDVNTYDAFISIKYTINEFESKNVSSEIRRKIGEAISKSSDIRINNRKWVLLNYPSKMDAYKAHMTYDEFYDLSFKVMTYDYSKMAKNIIPLKKIMEKTNKVRITAPNGTDITFSIENMPAIPCCGNYNLPDGEIYTAPIKNSVNGTITYNTPSIYNGNLYNNISLTFKNGKIINATCDGDNKALNEIFDTDEGARYIGEFAFGLNPLVLYPMGDILYDEKIIGSIHFTPGRCYKDADNKNDSSIHWDLVLIQRKDYGGGEIYFDDILIRKDGVFVLNELKPLNCGLK